MFEVDFLSMTEGTLHLVMNILFLCMKQSEGVVCLESIKSVNSIPKVYQNKCLYICCLHSICVSLYSLCVGILYTVWCRMVCTNVPKEHAPMLKFKQCVRKYDTG